MFIGSLLGAPDCGLVAVASAGRQNEQIPQKRIMPGQKWGQESVVLSCTCSSILDRTDGLMEVTGTYSAGYIVLLICLGGH